MATLTADQLADFRADIADDGTVFTDDELHRLYTRAGADYNTAVYLAWRQLLADANKFFDYTAGQTKLSKSQVREHIRDMMAFWKAEATTNAQQVRLVAANSVPPRWKDEPDA
jgi:hypothetical protein